MKKRWERPELVILSRSNSDEVLTLDCKHPTPNPTGPDTANNKCDVMHYPGGDTTKPGNCQSCAAESSGS